MPSDADRFTGSTTKLSPSYGGWYVRGCKYVQARLGPSPKKVEERRKRSRRKFMEAEKEYTKSSIEFQEIRNKYSDKDPAFKKALRRHSMVEKRFLKYKKIFEQRDFRQAVMFTGLDLELHEVILFAAFLATVIIGLSILAITISLMVLDIDIIRVVLYIAPVVLILPLFIFAFIASYPEILANRLRARSVGIAPEAVSYMIMSLRQTPSLSSALSFSADNSEEPLSSSMKRVLWNIYMRKHDSIDDSFHEFAMEWGEWNQEFQRSLFALKSAVLERTALGFERGLARANEIILQGTKRRMEEYAASLTGPTSILFALGILLPMVMGAMLPMASIGTPADPQQFSGAEGGAMTSQTNTESAPHNLPIIIIVVDILFPLFTFLYAYHILGKRPGTSSPPKVKSSLTKRQKRAIIVLSLAVCTVLCSLAVSVLMGVGNWAGFSYGSLPLLWAIGVPLGLYCLLTSREQKHQRDEIKKMEDELPDAIFQLGSRIAEGEPLERALGDTSRAMEGTSIAELFSRIAYAMHVTRGTPENVLFGEDGVLCDVQSRTIQATMKTVVKLVKKDARSAGQTIINISGYLRDMNKVEHDIKVKLSQTVQMMRTTGIFFAPLVMGITAAIYVLLSKELSNIPNAGSLIPTDIFFMILGIYLVFLIMITTYFTTEIEHGDDMIQLKYDLGRALPLVIAIFSLSVIFGQLMIG